MIINLDQASLDGFVKGDEKIFEIVYELLQVPLYAFAFGIVRQNNVAEDIVAETLDKLWRKREDMQGSRHIQCFVYVTARNKAIDHLRHRAKEMLSKGMSIEDLPRFMALADNARTTRELEQAEASVDVIMNRIEEEVRKLSPQRQRIFRLHFVEGRRVAEIAVIMGLARSTVYNQYYSSVVKIRNGLKSSGLDNIL